MTASDVITTPGSVANSISLSKQYGAGMLNFSNAYESAYNNSFYYSSELHITTQKVVMTRDITIDSNKTLRFALAWDKINTEETSYNLDSLSLQITTPSGTKYTSSYLFDNKQMISFNTTESGTYTITILRNYYSSSSQNINYAISYSLQ